MTEKKTEQEPVEKPAPLAGCESSHRLSDGSIYSQRGRASSPHWTQECQRVASFLNIPIEQHQGLHSVEYLAKDIPNPHKGLLASRMIYWLLADFHAESECAIGTLQASIYMPQGEGAGIESPIILHLQRFNAAFAAWPVVGSEGEEGDSHKDWVRIAHKLLNYWWAKIARELHQLEG